MPGSAKIRASELADRTTNREWTVSQSNAKRIVGRFVARMQLGSWRLGSWRFELGNEEFTGETWVQVPAEALSLAGFQPNPAQGTPVVFFTLPTNQSATLEVIDLRGRKIWSRDIGSLGPGSHSVEVPTAANLSPGVYWIRLTQADRSLTMRGVILR